MDSFIKGFGVTDNLMRQLLERRQLKQREDQFKEELALKKQAQARAGANSDLTRAIMQEQLLGLKHKNDPNYEFNQFKALQDMITGNGVPGGNASGNIIPAPQQEMGEGLGMFSPEGLVDAQQPTQMTLPVQAQGSMNFDALRQNPMLRGFFKHKFGFDPLAAVPQTPEDKQATALDLFKQKEAIKAANKSGETATNKVLTQNQQAVQAIDTVIPMIDELINNPDSIYGPMDFSPSKKAAYNAKTGGMIDMLVAAQSLPQVKESVNLVEEQIRRSAGESKDSYRKRLQDFRKDLLARKKKSVGVVNTKKVDTSIITPEETKTINGVKYEKINGEWHVAD